MTLRLSLSRSARLTWPSAPNRSLRAPATPELRFSPSSRKSESRGRRQDAGLGSMRNWVITRQAAGLPTVDPLGPEGHARGRKAAGREALRFEGPN